MPKQYYHQRQHFIHLLGSPPHSLSILRNFVYREARPQHLVCMVNKSVQVIILHSLRYIGQI